MVLQEDVEYDFDKEIVDERSGNEDEEYHSEAVTIGDKRYYMDGYLRASLDHWIKSVKHSWDFTLIIDGVEGCLCKGTKIKVYNGSKWNEYNIEYVYHQFHQRHLINEHNRWNLNIVRFAKSYDEKYNMINNKINDVVYSGKKTVYLLTLKNGYKIKATSDHEIKTEKGYKQLIDLVPGKDKVMIYDVRKQNKKPKRIKFYDIQLSVGKNHPYATRGRVEVHRLIYEASHNDLSLFDYCNILLNEPQIAKKFMFFDPKVWEIHHLDGNHYNNSIDNLKRITREEHLSFHAKNQQSQYQYPDYSIVEGVYHMGENETYDIKMEEPYHNFVANGIIVHNCGKSTFAKCIAHYFTHKFNPKNTYTLDNVVFTPEQFRQRLKVAPKGSVIHWDEMVLGGLSTDMTAIQNELIKTFTLIRKKNLFLILVIPNIWMLRSYFSADRSRNLIHTYSPDFIQRGFFSYYGYDKKRALFYDGLQSSSKHMYRVRPDFRGRFSKDISRPDFFFSDAEYEAKKDAAIESISNVGKKKEEQKQEEEDLLTEFKTTKTCKKCGVRGKLWFNKVTNVHDCKACGDIVHHQP